jgi:hypothetical protein
MLGHQQGKNQGCDALSPWIAFLSSFSIHLTCCLLLALVSFSGQGGIGQTFYVAAATASDESEPELLVVTSFDVAALEPSSREPLEVLPPVLESSSEKPVSFERSVDTKDLVVSQQDASAITRAVALGTKDLTQGDGPAEMSRAKFYGASIPGNRFVFVIDTSQSMKGERWESLQRELLRCIKSLSLDQKFFIISFDSEPHPMFGKLPPEGVFLSNTDKNLARVRSWLRSINLGHSTLPAASLGIALRLEPDAILLLSDGEIRDSSIDDLRTFNRVFNSDEETVKIPVHTFLLHSFVGYENLAKIAEENAGVFTPVNLSNHW